MHELGALGEQVGVASSGEGAADCKAGNANEGIHPGFPPVPAPGDQQRQEREDNVKKQHWTMTRGVSTFVGCSFYTSIALCCGLLFE